MAIDFANYMALGKLGAAQVSDEPRDLSTVRGILLPKLSLLLLKIYPLSRVVFVEGLLSYAGRELDPFMPAAPRQLLNQNFIHLKLRAPGLMVANGYAR